MKSLLIVLLVPAYMTEFLTKTRKRNRDTCNAKLPWHVSRKGDHDIPDFLFGTLMECPAELHGCSESLMSCEDGTYIITCSCASNCKTYRDCCWNVETTAETSKPEMSTSACQEVPVDFGVSNSVYMVVGCPPTWTQDDVRVACEEPSARKSSLYGIPATSIHHITYRNGFCALCNDDLIDATFWNPMMLGEDMDFVDMPDIVVMQPALHLRPCVARVLEDTCPENYPKGVRRKCTLYYAPVEDDLADRVYRNVYCAMCNGANLSHLSCSPAFHSRSPWIPRKEPLSVEWDIYVTTPSFLGGMFRPVWRTPDCYVEHDGHCYIKYRPVVDSLSTAPEGGRAVNETVPAPFTTEAPKKAHSAVYVLKSYVTIVSMSLSICCLLLKILVFCAYKESRCFSAKCTLGLTVTLLLTQLIVLATRCFTVSPVVCVASAVIVHYGLLSTMTWTTVLSYDIWRNLTAVKRLSSHKRALFVYAAISWGSPLGVVASALVTDQAAPESELAPGYSVVACWFGTPGGLIVYFLAPFFGLLLTCVFFYLKTVCYIRRTTSEVQCRSREDNIRAREYRNNLTLFVRLALIMGAVWSLAFVGIFFVNPVLDLLIDALIGLEGAYLFFAFRDYRYLCESRVNRGKKIPLSGPRTTPDSNISALNKSRRLMKEVRRL